MKGQLLNNRQQEHGPFDIIGDVHGCFAELKQLLTAMGYIVEKITGCTGTDYRAAHPEGRKAVFLGDLVDRGPQNVEVLKIVMNMVKAGSALCVAGNHDMRVLKKIQERNMLTSHGGPDWSVVELKEQGEDFLAEVQRFMEGLASHYVLDDGKLVVAHAGLKEAFQGKDTTEAREFALYGELTGATDEYGLAVRYDWAADYKGRAMVIYGHTPQAQLRKVNNTINIDTGCVFGGKLTACRYPEGEFMTVKAARTYCPPAKPFLPHHVKGEKMTIRSSCAMYGAKKTDDEAEK